jgi:hypothetical protein
MDNDYGTPDAENQEQAVVPDTRFEDQKRRAEKAEAEAKELRGQLEALQPKAETKQELLPTQEAPIRFDTLADNLSVLRQLEDDEVTELQSQSKDLGVDPVKFAKSSAWKAHLDALRTKKKSESRTPEPSYRTAVFEGKTFSQVVGDDKASDDMKQKAFEAQRDSLLKRGRNQMM